MHESTVVLDAEGRLTLSRELREALGVRPGDAVVVRVAPPDVIVSTPRATVKHVQRVLRLYLSAGGSLVDELAAERREAAENE